MTTTYGWKPSLRACQKIVPAGFPGPDFCNRMAWTQSGF